MNHLLISYNVIAPWLDLNRSNFFTKSCAKDSPIRYTKYQRDLPSSSAATKKLMGLHGWLHPPCTREGYILLWSIWHITKLIPNISCAKYSNLSVWTFQAGDSAVMYPLTLQMCCQQVSPNGDDTNSAFVGNLSGDICVCMCGEGAPDNRFRFP